MCVRDRNSFREFPKIFDAFPEHTTSQRFDHVVVDVGSLSGLAAKAGAGLTGRDRDEETVAYLHRLIFNRVLKNYASPKKSVALIFDGTDPLWKVFNGRYNDGSAKKFESRFYRGCCSPMNFMLEERMRLAMGGTIPQSMQQVAMLGNFPTLKGSTAQTKEFVLSSPGAPGPAEGKISAWLADLSYRAAATAAITATSGHHQFPPITLQDSVALVGGPELFLTGMHTSLKNVSTVAIGSGRGERKVFGQQDVLEWMSLDGLIKDPTANVVAERQVRYDAVLLFLLGHGTQTTQLPSCPSPFPKAIDAYLRRKMLDAGGVVVVERSASSGAARMGLRLKALLELVGGEGQVVKRKDANLTTDDHLSSEYLELLGQSLLMYCDGGIGDASYLPPMTCAQQAAPGASSPLKPQALRSYIALLIEKGRAEKTEDPVWFPRVNRDFALTVSEQLLLSSKTGADPIRQILPAYTGGHQLPDPVVSWFAEKPKTDSPAATPTPTPSKGGSGLSVGRSSPTSTPAAASSTANVCAEFTDLVSKAQMVMSHVQPIVAFRGNVVAESAADSLLKGVSGLEAGGDDDKKLGGNSYHPAARHMPSYYFYQRRGAMGPPSGTEFLPINLGVMAREEGIAMPQPPPTQAAAA